MSFVYGKNFRTPGLQSFSNREAYATYLHIEMGYTVEDAEAESLNAISSQKGLYVLYIEKYGAFDAFSFECEMVAYRRYATHFMTEQEAYDAYEALSKENPEFKKYAYIARKIHH